VGVVMCVRGEEKAVVWADVEEEEVGVDEGVDEGVEGVEGVVKRAPPGEVERGGVDGVVIIDMRVGEAGGTQSASTSLFLIKSSPFNLSKRRVFDSLRVKSSVIRGESCMGRG
jgi:hypothetical protein